MASAWGKAWGNSWGNSWGIISGATTSPDSGGNLATQDWARVLNRPRKMPVRVRVRAYAWHDHRASCWIHIRARVPATVARHESVAFAYRPKIRSRIYCQSQQAPMVAATSVPRLRFRAQAVFNPPSKIRLGGPAPITDHEAILAVIAYKQR